MAVKQLKDAGDAIENYARGEVDVICSPSEPDVVTDGEDFDDNDILTAAEILADVPGFIEVDFGEQTQPDTASDEWDESDQEPLGNKQKRMKHSVKMPHNWKRTKPAYNLFSNFEDGASVRLEKIKSEKKL